MKILVITFVFPNSIQPTLGVFVRERMFKVAKYIAKSQEVTPKFLPAIWRGI